MYNQIVLPIILFLCIWFAYSLLRFYQVWFLLLLTPCTTKSLVLLIYIELSHNSFHDCCGFQFGFELVSVKNTITAITLCKRTSLYSIFLTETGENAKYPFHLWNENNVNNKFSIQNIKSRSTYLETTINICQKNFNVNDSFLFILIVVVDVALNGTQYVALCTAYSSFYITLYTVSYTILLYKKALYINRRMLQYALYRTLHCRT